MAHHSSTKCSGYLIYLRLGVAWAPGRAYKARCKGYHTGGTLFQHLSGCLAQIKPPIAPETIYEELRYNLNTTCSSEIPNEVRAERMRVCIWPVHLPLHFPCVCGVELLS